MTRFRLIPAAFVTALAILLLAGGQVAAQRIFREAPSSPRSRKAVKQVTPKLEAEASKSGLALGMPVFMRIFKEDGALEVWLAKNGSYSLFKTYKICTFSGRLGPKLKKGDGQAPEGFYSFGPGAMNPVSSFHLSFDLGYPNRYDRAQGRTGSALMVHGNCVSIGCYAMGDSAIEEIWTLSAAAFFNGQQSIQVHAFPFRLTGENLKKHGVDRWTGFWENLKTGYDLFEKNRVPPAVGVKGGRYVFGGDK